MSDQTIKHDAHKPRISLVPPAVIRAVARIREYGLAKYPAGGRDNWKKVEPERYVDALGRHYLAVMQDYKSIDPESGMPHMWHIACNAAFIIQLMDDITEEHDDS